MILIVPYKIFAWAATPVVPWTWNYKTLAFAQRQKRRHRSREKIINRNFHSTQENLKIT